MQKYTNAAVQAKSGEMRFDCLSITKTALAVVVMSVLATACSSDDGEELLEAVERGEFGLQSLETSTTDITLSVGQTSTLKASASFRDGTAKALDGIVWESLDPAVASVDANGAVTAVGEGSTNIVVTLRDESAQTAVSVTQATIEAISLTPASLELPECGVATVSAHTVYSDGAEYDLPASAILSVADATVVTAQRLPAIDEGAQEQSNSADTSVTNALVDAQIQLVSHNAGTTQLTVTVGDISSVVPVVALDTLSAIDIGGDVITLVPGEALNLSATGSYSDSSSADISSFGSWSLIAEDGTDLSVSVSVLDTPGHEEVTDTDPDESDSDEPFAVLSNNGDGSTTLRTRQSGVAVLQFECGGLTQSAQVIIDSSPGLQSISIDDSDALELVAGSAVAILASAILTDGTIGEFKQEVEWAVSDDTAGFEITSGSNGAVLVEVNTLIETSVELLATVGDVVGSVTLVANAGGTESLREIRLSIEDETGVLVPVATGRVLEVEVGDVIQLQLIGELAGGQLETLEQVTWVNATPAVATVDQDGLVSALSVGSTFISAFTEGGQIHLPLMVSEVNSGTEEAGATNWSDSYSVNGQCYCDSDYDHGLSSMSVDTPDGLKLVPQICDDINALLGNGASSPRIYYNTIQCGHGPVNDAGDESVCPGIPAGDQNYTGARCSEKGATWNLAEIYSQEL